MKKIFLLISLIVCLQVVCAASTCETRVDKHQQATTLQRVNYCLSPDQEPEVSVEEPDLVYYGVVDKTPSASREKKASSRRQTYFKEQDLSVYRNYVGTDKFPTLENDILSEKEIQARREAALLEQQEALKSMQGEAGSFAVQKPQRKVVAQQEVSVENAKGLAVRLKKPGRFMRMDEPNSNVQLEEAVTEDEPVADAPQNATISAGTDDSLEAWDDELSGESLQ